MATIFNSNIIGPPPGNATTGTDQWIDLGVIPSGYKIFFGSAQYSSPDKSITFELRTNNSGLSSGSDGATTLLNYVSATPKSGTLNVDLYRKGRLHITSVLGTGTEHWWLRLKSKTSTAGSYLYTVNYTLE